MNCVLILNADYSPMGISPLQTLSWRDAIRLSYLDQIEIIEYYNDWFVHSPSVTLQVPSVVVNKNYVKTSRSVKFNKYNLCVRDSWTCQYCKKQLDSKTLTMDHVLPKCLGGKTTWTNIVMACHKCNTQKGHKTTMKPAVEPYKPTIGEIGNKVKHTPIVIPNENWIPYIGWPPKLITVKEPNKNLD